MISRARFSLVLFISLSFWCDIICNRLPPKENSVEATELIRFDNNEISNINSESDLESVPMEPLTNYDFNWCVQDENCEGPKEICIQHACICRDPYEYNDMKKCVLCPGLGDRCKSCCGHSSLACINDVCTCVAEMCQGTQGVIITASQIALSAALIMGFAALAMVVYRLCTKPRYLTARQRAAAERATDGVNAGPTRFLRASLSSIQIRVLSRLRDRPPTYENQARARQEVSQTTQDHVQPVEAPPPYEGNRDSDTHLPPPYSELILSPEGFINPAYVDTETNPSRLNDSEPKQVIENSNK